MIIEIKNKVRKNKTSRGMCPRVIVLKCDICNKEFERKYSKNYYKMKIHRCSIKCVYGTRSTDGLGGHGADIVTIICCVCDKETTLRKTSAGIRKWGYMCSRKCYSVFRKKYPDLYIENTQKMHTPEAAKKISNNIIKRMQHPDFKHSRLGKHHTEKTKQLISRHHKESMCMKGSKNGMFGKRHTKLSRESMSEKHVNNLNNGLSRPYGKNSQKGLYLTKDERSFYTKSNWEFVMMKWLDNSEDVLFWNYESIKISYYYNEHKRHYVPDFIVTFIDKHQELWEIKPKEFVSSKINLLKTAAAENWIKNNNITCYKILTGDDLKIMKII